MLSNEMVKRVNESIIETNKLIAKKSIEYKNSITVLKMEIEENKELGNSRQANKLKVNSCNEIKKRLEELQEHKQKLLNMLSQKTVLPDNKTEIGSKIIGYWGAMFPYSYGSIVKIEDNNVYIKWDEEPEPDQDEFSIEPLTAFQFGDIKGIGLYIR
ncbi:MAG TPA: hypothetical protein VIK86_07900 [Candidatus Paceibacterota bacterium]